MQTCDLCLLRFLHTYQHDWVEWKTCIISNPMRPFYFLVPCATDYCYRSCLFCSRLGTDSLLLEEEGSHTFSALAKSGHFSPLHPTSDCFLSLLQVRLFLPQKLYVVSMCVRRRTASRWTSNLPVRSLVGQ